MENINEEIIIDEVTLQRRNQLEQLYTNLCATDYKIMKYIEGQLTEQEYLTLKNQRQSWRDEINRLEGLLK